MSITRLTCALALCLALAGCASMGSGSISEKQAEILTMKDQVLLDLFRKKPDTQAQINAAAGYAVFSNANLHFFFVSAGTGYGVVVDNSTGNATYMNMAEGGLGFGLGAKDYRIVMVFHTAESMQHFIHRGWTVGGNADATAKASQKGVSLAGETYYGNVTIYTFTQSGLALQATIKGVKFWQDSTLN